jgi:hypothetical protein
VATPQRSLRNGTAGPYDSLFYLDGRFLDIFQVVIYGVVFDRGHNVLRVIVYLHNVKLLHKLSCSNLKVIRNLRFFGCPETLEALGCMVEVHVIGTLSYFIKSFIHRRFNKQGLGCDIYVWGWLCLPG